MIEYKIFERTIGEKSKTTIGKQQIYAVVDTSIAKPYRKVFNISIKDKSALN